jgi:hypothetical protein
MSAIVATGSSTALNALAQILGNGASSATSGIPQIGETTAPVSSAPSTSNPTDTLDLSDHAKATLAQAATETPSDQAKAAAAARAQSDQAAADRLQAFVEAHRVNTRASAETNSIDNLRSILDTSTQPTGIQPADAQPTTSGSKVEAIVAQITTVADANEPPPFQPFTPTKSLSNSVTIDGFTLTLDTNAGTQFYGYNLSGNGVEHFTDHFGPSDGAGGDSGAPPGVTISGNNGVNNNEAEDSITITTNVAASSSASVSSSSAGSASASAVSAQSSSVTFLVNYATGQISAQETALSVSAQSTRLGAPGSTLSTLA